MTRPGRESNSVLSSSQDEVVTRRGSSLYVAGPFERPDQEWRTMALEHMLALPDDVDFP